MARKKKQVVEKWYAVKLYARTEYPYFALRKGFLCSPAIFSNRVLAREFADSIISDDHPQPHEVSVVRVTITG